MKSHNIFKPKKCKVCKEVFTPVKQLQSVCGYKCAINHAKELESKKQKANDKKTREGLKTLSQYEAYAKREFQKWIRLRDKDLPCISCNNPNAKSYHGGHWKKAEIYSGLIFDERNVHKQCSRCNVFLGGNEGEYRIGLVNRYGNEYVEQLESDSIIKRNYKYTKDELIEIKNVYNEKIKAITRKH